MSTPSLDGRRLLLVIGGGIAAYKSLDLIRRLRERGATVRCILTAGAQHFVTPLAAAALAGTRVQTDLFDRTDEAEIGHIRLARDTDAVVVAPATADLMAKMAGGHADDLATAVLLATDRPILIAPAMNPHMWAHPATARNLSTLQADGVHVVGPNDGPMAEPETGRGRMAEPLEIVAAVEQMLGAEPSPRRGEGRVRGSAVPGQGAPSPGAPAVRSASPAPGEAGAAQEGGALAGRRVLVTSGPTHEPIDPVRYLANRSSGRQGHAIAAAAAEAGATVTLVSGPVGIPDPPGVGVVRVETAREMMAAAEAALPADIAVFAAAVADWRVAEEAADKIKKSGAGRPELRLVENPDILATVAQRATGRPALVVGFAAETERVLDHARSKLDRKGCDLIVANDVGPATGIMGGTHNEVHLVSREGVESWPTLGKDDVARRLVARFAQLLDAGR